MTPIKPENKALYPDNWQEIRARIAQRSRNACELCRKPNGIEVSVGEDGSRKLWCRVPRAGEWTDQHGEKTLMGPLRATIRKIRVVLTVAHLDQDPTNNDPDNLLHLCQRCHFEHDREANLEKAKATREQKRREQ